MISVILSFRRATSAHLFFLLFFILLTQPITVYASGSKLEISINAPSSLLSNSAAKLAVDDSISLLSRAFPKGQISLNNKHADIEIILPSINGIITRDRGSLTASTEPSKDSYRWAAIKRGNKKLLKLEAQTSVAVASGLYALLQEQLNIRFIHPRQTILPVYGQWPLKDRFTFSGQPRFTNRGFHLHTLHPMELTEQLHNHLHPGAFEDVTAYLDWLARNGQNSFQFFLLRNIDRKAWIPHISRIVEYAHKRGIRCGVEISISMLQQQAFQTITLLKPFPSYNRQIEKTIAWLFQIPWDFITVETMMGEHLPLTAKISPEAQKYMEYLITEKYKKTLLVATHVIAQAKGEKVRRPFNPKSGILIHTVMCYSASEAKAPVYGNKNQRLMLEAAISEKKKRETWYWPESSYWVAFDTSVPLLLLPYLDSRWSDINLMNDIGLNGHLTFSTGWEWGYWLVDWSIARWSWLYIYNGNRLKDSPVSRLFDIFHDPIAVKEWQFALNLQNHFLKDLELLRYITASTPFAELPSPLRFPFQPEPDFSYRWLLKKADPSEIERIVKGPVANLEQYASSMEKSVERLHKRTALLYRDKKINDEINQLADELITGLKVSALRARHRAFTFRAMASKRSVRDLPESELLDFNQYLSLARETRNQAMVFVKEREADYRYPVELIARRRQSLTAYPFGYLYTTGRLFFWEREEEQARVGRFDPFFMNIWDIRKTAGFESLFFK